MLCWHLDGGIWTLACGRWTTVEEPQDRRCKLDSSPVGTQPGGRSRTTMM